MGVASAALIGALVFWAGRDATPAPVETPPMAGNGNLGDTNHPAIEQLSPQARARATSLLARLEQNPGDVDARKALTEVYVLEGLFFEAYTQSEILLEQRPGDVDGLYFQGLVRLTMGDMEQAIELLDQALAQEPRFISARLVRGIAKMREGDREAAIEDWRVGLEASGGAHPGLQQLLSMAEAGADADEILSSPPPQSSTAAVSGPEFSARIEVPLGGGDPLRSRALRLPAHPRTRPTRGGKENRFASFSARCAPGPARLDVGSTAADQRFTLGATR